jgi:hypothetical protein
MVHHGSNACIMLTIFGFLFRIVERYSVYFIFNELLFEFLSFDEFKFVKSVGKDVCRHGDDAPTGRMAAFGRGRHFWAGVLDL